MTALPPHQLSQAQRNAEDYDFGLALNETHHGATDDDLIRRNYSPAVRHRIMKHREAQSEAKWRQAPEVKA